MFYKMIFLCDIKFISNTMNTWYVEIIQNQKDTSLITIKHVWSRSIKIHLQPISDLVVFWFELLCRFRDQFVILVNSWAVLWILLSMKMCLKIFNLPDETRYFNVGDGFWMQNVLATTFRCWWRFRSFWSPAWNIFLH